MIIAVKGNQNEFKPSMLKKTKDYVISELGIEESKINLIDVLVDNIDSLRYLHSNDKTAVIFYDVGLINKTLQLVLNKAIRAKLDNVTVLLLVDRNGYDLDKNPLLKCATKVIDIDEVLK